MIRFLVVTLVSFIVLIPTSFAKTEAGKADLAREKRMAAEVEDAVLDGEVIFLKGGANKEGANKDAANKDSANAGHEFMAIDQAPEDKTKGAVIILHGRGFHPNWQDTIYPLRTQLPAKGWRTLSLQMPLMQKSAKYFDYVPLFPQATPRIEAGIKYLQEQGIKNIVLLAHSCGGHMAMDWIRSKEGKVDKLISAYIGAGMGATDFGQKMKQPFPYESLKIPVLDVYGSKEYPAVLTKAPERLMMIMKAANPKSKQVIVPGANHYFTDKGDELVKPVADWLDNL